MGTHTLSLTHTHHTHVHNLPNELLESEESARSVATTAEHDIGLDEEWSGGKIACSPRKRGEGAGHPHPDLSVSFWTEALFGARRPPDLCLGWERGFPSFARGRG